jgi:hypothetical protein
MKHNGQSLKIEHDVPASGYDDRGRPRKYPFNEMKPGDSFLVSTKEKQICSSARQYGSRHGWKFVARRVEGGYRCWRIS